jgi:hypothetical protein
MTIERVVYVRPEMATRPSAVTTIAHNGITTSPPESSSAAYLRLWDEITRDGLSVLPRAPAGDGGFTPGLHGGPAGPFVEPRFIPGWDLPNERS